MSGVDFAAASAGARTASHSNYWGRFLPPLQQTECKFVKFYVKVVQPVNIFWFQVI